MAAERPPAVRRHPHPVRRQPGRDGGPERRRQGRPAVHGRHRAAPLSSHGAAAPARSARPDGFPPPRRTPSRPAWSSPTCSATDCRTVQVRNGEVAVALCHGRYGQRRLLAGAQFGAAMSATRVYFADVDGSGAADIVYAAVDHLLVFRNQSGNGYSAPLRVPLPLRLSPTDQISFSDIRGNGTTAIVITRVSPEVEHWPATCAPIPSRPSPAASPICWRRPTTAWARPPRCGTPAPRASIWRTSGPDSPGHAPALPRAGGHGGAQRRCGLPGVIHAALRLSRRLLRSGGAAVPWLRHGGELGRRPMRPSPTRRTATGRRRAWTTSCACHRRESGPGTAWAPMNWLRRGGPERARISMATEGGAADQCLRPRHHQRRRCDRPMRRWPAA